MSSDRIPERVDAQHGNGDGRRTFEQKLQAIDGQLGLTVSRIQRNRGFEPVGCAIGSGSALRMRDSESWTFSPPNARLPVIIS